VNRSPLAIWATLVAGTMVAVWLIGSSYLGLRAADVVRSQAEREYANESQRLTANAGDLTKPTIAAALEQPTEETTFYNTFRGWCEKEDVRLTRYTTQPRDPVDQAAGQKVKPRVVTVVLEAHYPNIRRALLQMERGPRLVNISRAEWQRAESGRTKLTLTLTRYVAPSP